MVADPPFRRAVRTLHLLRHAESAAAAVGVTDHDRVLTARGREVADRLGGALREPGALPGLILCSTARRARETVERIGLAAAEHQFDRGLYDASADDLLERLREIVDTVGVVLLVGHNPAVHELVTRLAGTGTPAGRLAAGFPAGALATVTAPVDRWRDLAPGGAQLVRFIVPDELE